MTVYYPDDANTQPHVLTPILSAWHGGVRWEVHCPHTGPRACGLVEECTGSEKDVEKWGCERFPEPPKDYGDAGPESDEARDAWQKFEAARERWRDEVHGGYEWHRTEKCFFEYAVKAGDFDAEYFLDQLPQDMVIPGPMKVRVGYEGSGEDTEPKFKLWEEPSDGETS